MAYRVGVVRELQEVLQRRLRKHAGTVARGLGPASQLEVEVGQRVAGSRGEGGQQVNAAVHARVGLRTVDLRDWGEIEIADSVSRYAITITCGRGPKVGDTGQEGT